MLVKRFFKHYFRNYMTLESLKFLPIWSLKFCPLIWKWNRKTSPPSSNIELHLVNRCNPYQLIHTNSQAHTNTPPRTHFFFFFFWHQRLARQGKLLPVHCLNPQLDLATKPASPGPSLEPLFLDIINTSKQDILSVRIYTQAGQARMT